MNVKGNHWLTIACILVLAICLVGCGGEKAQAPTQTPNDIGKAEEAIKESSLKLSLEEYPVVDGSTANLPLMANVMSRVCQIPLSEAETLVSASKTAVAWRNIAGINQPVDLLLVYAAPDSVQDELRECGTELEITPIGVDALVFMENEQNPVESLTQEQLRDIYTGRVTNWKEVGGEDQSIVPFQRVETSGSQTLFLRRLMKGETPTDAPTELRPEEMGMLVDCLADYNNEGNAIGYSVFYYIEEMYSQPGLKMIAVDGVQPTKETIACGEYPLLNEFYVVIRKDAAEDSPARQLRDWLLTEEGRDTLEDAGYIPVANNKAE